MNSQELSIQRGIDEKPRRGQCLRTLRSLFELAERGIPARLETLSTILAQPVGRVRFLLSEMERQGLVSAENLRLTMLGLALAASQPSLDLSDQPASELDRRQPVVLGSLPADACGSAARRVALAGRGSEGCARAPLSQPPARPRRSSERAERVRPVRRPPSGQSLPAGWVALG